MTDHAPVPEGRSGFERANDESRARLAHLVKTLTPTQLEIDLGEGWTVASALAHTGFWDRWQAERWTKLLDGTWSGDDDSVIAAEHLANEALHPYWAGAAAEDIPALALDAATRLDALIASAPDALVARILASPSAYLVKRFRHRGEHVDHIERGIAAAASAPLERDFVAKNTASRKRLAALVERLRESDMTLITEEGGWTVAQALAHVAFWDRSSAARWRAARAAAAEGKPLDPFGIPYELLEGINPPLVELVGAWTGQLGGAIAREAVKAAEAVDAIVEELADSIPDSLLAEKPNSVARWPHRDSHIDQIERALAEGRPAAAPVDRGYLARNESSLARLRELAGRLTPGDLAGASGEGSWTIGQIIGHLTFWDRFHAARWRAARAAGPNEQPSYFPHEVSDILNEAQPATWLAYAEAAPHVAISQMLAAAEEMNAVIAGLPDSVPVEAILAERPSLLDRSLHRSEHLETLESALSGRRR